MEKSPYSFQQLDPNRKKETFKLEYIPVGELDKQIERRIRRDYKAGNIYSLINNDMNGTKTFILCLSDCNRKRVMICPIFFKPIDNCVIEAGDIEIGFIAKLNSTKVAYTNIDLLQNVSVSKLEQQIYLFDSSIESVTLNSMLIIKIFTQIEWLMFRRRMSSLENKTS